MFRTLVRGFRCVRFLSSFFLLQDLQGQGEIIGVADTGLDLNHCQFKEDDGDNIEPSEWDDPITDKTKRKVVQYIEYVDGFDGEKYNIYAYRVMLCFGTPQIDVQL